MGNYFGAVIPVTGLNNGFLGQVSRTGDRVILSRQANSNNAANINFGDVVVTMPDSAGGTFKQFADFIANGGTELTTASTTSSSAVITPASMAGFQVGQFVFGSGIPAGSQVASIGSSTVTLNQEATATASGVAISVGAFAGIAVREIKTELAYPYTPGTPEIGYYAPGEMAEALQRGSCNVKVNVGTPVAVGAVYIRISTNSSVPAGVVGDLEAQPDGSHTILLSNVEWRTGVLDANNVAEVTLLIRQSA